MTARSKSISIIGLICGLMGCGGDPSAAPQAPSSTGSAVSGAGMSAGGAPATAGASAGMSAANSSAGMVAAGAGAAAGGGAGSAAGAGGAHACSIPDDIMITAADADGGVPADCQNVPRKVIANNCIGGYCHDSAGLPAGNLDLMAPCVAERLVRVKSSCMDMLYLDPDHPERSFLTDKLNTEPGPKCGKPMPDGTHLPPDERRCINAWINAVLRAAR